MTDPELFKSLRDTETVELVVIGNRTRCCHKDTFIEDGRPHALSSISLATWALLSGSIKDYRNGMQSYTRRFVLVPLLLFYFTLIMVISLPGPDIFWMAQLIFYCVIFLYAFAIRRLLDKYLRDELHPAVARVVDELRPAIAENGFEVEYIVHPGWRRRSVLLFHRREEVP